MLRQRPLAASHRRTVPSRPPEARSLRGDPGATGCLPILRFAKRGVNQWYRLAELVTQDHATTMEALSFYAGELPATPYYDWPPRAVP